MSWPPGIEKFAPFTDAEKQWTNDRNYFSDIKLTQVGYPDYLQVLVTLRYDAKWKEGEEYNVQAAHLWTLNDGKITGFQQYVDTKTIAMTDIH